LASIHGGTLSRYRRNTVDFQPFADRRFTPDRSIPWGAGCRAGKQSCAADGDMQINAPSFKP
jgi:hypothetical protein